MINPTSDFRWATGVECSFIPHLGIDQYRWTQHDRLWREDLPLIADDLGCRWLRYALPWHEIERQPGQFDWRWFDERLAVFESLGINLMLDLVHFGTPTWLPDAFADPDLPAALERFARAFGERYAGRVGCVCPINEPLITALFCGDIGLWPPYGRGLESYMVVLNRVAQALSRSIKVLRETMPGVEILVSDSLEVAVTYEDSSEKTSPFLRESLRDDVARRMNRRHVVLDLVLGRVDDRHPLLSWLLRHGFSDYDLRWFRRNAQTIDIVGLDYYEHTEVELFTTPEGYYRQRSLQPPMGLYRAAQDYWTRYRIPLMVTETSAAGPDEVKLAWLEKSVNDVRRLRAEGFPVVGYTWWPVIDHLDWDGALLHQTGHIHAVGIYRLERQPGQLVRRPTGLRDAYRALIAGGNATAGELAANEVSADRRETHGGSQDGSVGSERLGFPIIAHSRAAWHGLWQRPQQIFARLAKRHPVLYVDPPLWEESDDCARTGLSFHPLFPNLYSLRLYLPGNRRDDPEWTRRECRRLLAEALAQPPLAGRFDAPVQWIDNPADAAIYGGQESVRAVVADCADQPPDGALLALADCVFTPSRQIQKLVSATHPRCFFAPHGVDVAHFGKARGRHGRVAVPHDMQFIPQPVLGYFGVIDERLDYELISALAHASDAWSVVMVGPVRGIDPDRLPRRHNLFWLGQRPHPEMPDYAHGFRVCIAPFAMSAATQFHRPLKMNEYIRSGRPVVCTNLEEVRHDFKGIVDIAHSQEEFIESCRRAIDAPDQEAIRRGLAATAQRGWHRLANAMEGWINETLKAKESVGGIVPRALESESQQANAAGHLLGN